MRSHARAASRSRVALIGLLLALFCIAVAPPVAAATPPTTWNPLVKVSRNDNTRSFEPSIAIDRDGFQHVVWSGGLQPLNWLVLYSSNRGGQWSRPRVIGAGRGEHREVAIVASDDGHLHVVYAQRTQGQVYYQESSDFGARWSAPYQVSQSRGGRADKPAVAADAASNVFITWIDSRNGLYQTFVTSRVAGRWGPRFPISRVTRDDAPDIALTGAGPTQRIHVVYGGRPRGSKSNADYELYYASGTPTRFDPARRLTDDEQPLYNPVIASDGQGDLFVAYEQIVERQGHTIFLTRSPSGGAQWTPPQAVSPPDAYFPAIAWGKNYNQPSVTVGFQVGQYQRARILTLDYYPRTNSFGGAHQLFSRTGGESTRVALAGSGKVNRTAGVYQGKDNRNTYKIYSADRSLTIGARPVLNGGALLTNNPLVTVDLADVSGAPNQVRLSVDRPLTVADSWQPFTTRLPLTLPTNSATCTRTIYAQVRNAEGIGSTPSSTQIVLDTRAQARLELRNPGLGALNYTRTPSALALVYPDQECTRLTNTVPPTGVSGGFLRGVIPFDAGAAGPRSVAVTVLDAAGNRTPYTATISYDPEPPTLVAGTLHAPTEPLSSVLITLRVTGLEARDNLFPGGYWALQLANALPGTPPEALRWTTRLARVAPNGELLVSNWSVAAGLGRPVGDVSLAEVPLEVRLRVLDGAGNPSPEQLRATVRLAPNYRAAEYRLPIIGR
jgi:hypothetical protein